jgi:hypothetical protein
VTDFSHHAEAFGTSWLADLPLRHFESASGFSDRPVIRVARRDQLPERATIARRNRGMVYADGFRFRWENEVTFDFHAPGRLDYCPGPDWHGAVPDCFYSTVAALALSWNGGLPLHASAIEWQGKGIIVAGKAGAGKSTLAAELLSQGARLISDDLTMLSARGPEFDVLQGRPGMRLYPGTAQTIEIIASEAVPADPRGKLLVRPASRSTSAAVPLAGLILLGGLHGRLSPAQLLRMLPAHQFRPGWSALVPGAGQRRAWLIELASRTPAMALAPLAGFDRLARDARRAATLAALQELTG